MLTSAARLLSGHRAPRDAFSPWRGVFARAIMPNMKSVARKALLNVFKLGYRVNDAGLVIAPDGSAVPLIADRYGYLRFSVRASCGICVPVHRLAALQHFGASALFRKGVVVKHADRQKQNNAKSNLKLAKRLHTEPAGVRKLTEDQAREILTRHRAGDTQTALAKLYAVNVRTVNKIVLGHTYREAAL